MRAAGWWVHRRELGEFVRDIHNGTTWMRARLAVGKTRALRKCAALPQACRTERRVSALILWHRPVNVLHSIDFAGTYRRTVFVDSENGKRKNILVL
jgi:hypothetical protein